jgi:hypothetical protein
MATHAIFGILNGDRTPDNPSGVVKSWDGPVGRQMAEVFTRLLVWETSFVFIVDEPVWI